MAIPTITNLMSPIPVAIDASHNVKVTRARMTEHGVRHLPVIKDGNLFGIITDRDIRWAEALLAATGAQGIPSIEELCSKEVLTIHVDEGVDVVAAKMADRRLGAAVVVDDKKRIVGIITTVDLCREFGRLVARLRLLESAA